MNHEETLFEQALGLDSQQAREAFLRNACAGDEVMFERLQGLLQAHDRAGKFLEHERPAEGAPVFVVPPSGGPGAAPPEGGTTINEGGTTSLLMERPGDRIGRYKLLQKIGEGGCGVVYMAEQEEPVRRRVALKIIKLGMDTRQVIARFEAERQALAMMDHPNIAKVFDAGVASSAQSQISNFKSQIHGGRPYFVMELVRGVKITTFCDQQKLSTRQRLDLFVQVCQAVQHAHQKGIIHRDLKPSNILVTEQDGSPMPKIIDFGIAKATTDQRLTDKTLFTAFEQFIGTPAYMSPEQAGLGGLDIDTRSDIYSLGVLLYELLTGQPPFDSEKLACSALDEILRTIRETDPPRPSARLTTFTEQELTIAAQRRQTEPTKLPYLLRGDLDWIVMKAIDKDRRRRYETANGLATDLQRFLGNEPVLARPPSTLYRFRKLARRNKVAFAAAIAVLAALSLGWGISNWSLHNEREAHRRASIAAAKSQQVARFLKAMLAGVGPSMARGRDTKMLREILDKTAERLGKELTKQPEVEADLRNTIGDVYRELGQYSKAEEMLRASLSIRRRLFGDNNLQVADSLHDLTWAMTRHGKQDRVRLAEAEGLCREALAIVKHHFGNEDEEVLLALNSLAVVLHDQGRLQEAEAIYREVLSVRKNTDDGSGLGSSLNNLALVLEAQGKLPEAEALLEEGLELLRKLHRLDTPQAATLLGNLGTLQTSAGKRPEAEATLRQVLALQQKLLGEDHPNTIATMQALGDNLNRQRRLDESEVIYRDALALQRKAEAGKESLAVAGAINAMAGALRAQKKFGESETLQRESLAIIKKLDPGSRSEAGALSILGGVLHRQAKFSEAETCFLEAELLYNKLLPPSALDKPENVGLLRARGSFLASHGKWKEAAADYAKALELLPSSGNFLQLPPLLVMMGDLDGYRKLCQQMLSRFADTKDRHTAEQLARACLQLPSPGTDLATVAAVAERAVKIRETPWTSLCRGLAELRQGHYAQAIEWTERGFGKPTTDSHSRDVQAYMVLAIAHYRLGETDKAHAAWAKGSQLAESELPRLDSGYIEGWEQVLAASILMKEAKALIEGDVQARSEHKEGAHE